jgi:hypothetical protein
VQCPALKPITGYHERATAPISSALRGDTSKLTCYHCGKTRHIASNSKCLQYKKPEQQQIFAAQVLNDRSDGEQPEQTEVMDGQDEEPEPVKEGNLDKGSIEQPDQDYYPDSLQYEDEELSYNDYDSYEQLSDNNEPIYIQAMNDEEELSDNLAFKPFNNMDWRP